MRAASELVGSSLLDTLAAQLRRLATELKDLDNCLDVAQAVDH